MRWWTSTIVGARAVGCVLANRLFCGRDNQVPRLEYGGGDTNPMLQGNLTRLGLPRPPAEIYVDRIDWHQVARLVHRGCPPRLTPHRRPLVAAEDFVRTTSGSPPYDARESEPEIR